MSINIAVAISLGFHDMTKIGSLVWREAPGRAPGDSTFPGRDLFGGLGTRCAIGLALASNKPQASISSVYYGSLDRRLILSRSSNSSATTVMRSVDRIIPRTGMAVK